MKTDYTKVEALQKQKYFESKFDLIPTELKNIYSAIGGQDVLVARELCVDGHVVIGIEYAPNGDVASAYTTDKRGKRVNIENVETASNESAPKDLISRRLDELSKTIAQRDTTHAQETPEPQPRTKAPTRVKKTALRSPTNKERA